MNILFLTRTTKFVIMARTMTVAGCSSSTTQTGATETEQTTLTAPQPIPDSGGSTATRSVQL